MTTAFMDFFMTALYLSTVSTFEANSAWIENSRAAVK
jgi:hypothetical protein